MELTKKQVSINKGVAILFMLLLHLFCTKDYQGLFTPLIIIKGVPLVYYLALFGDCCVAIYCFCSGYGLMCTYKNNPDEYNKKNTKRILKLYINFWIIIFLYSFHSPLNIWFNFFCWISNNNCIWNIKFFWNNCLRPNNTPFWYFTSL